MQQKKSIDSTKIIFFGTSDFAVPSLKALQTTNYQLLTVITQSDKPTGRKQILSPPPVKVAAQDLKIPVLQFESLKSVEVQSQILNIKPDIAVVVSYGKIIPQSLLDKIPNGFINVHPSLLPKYRGATPIQSAILNGDTETGISIILVDSEMDHGPLLAQEPITITDNDNYSTLSERLADQSANLLVSTLSDYLDGKIKFETQDHTQATFTRPLKREDGNVDWTSRAKVIYNQWRAYTPWPGIFTFMDNTRIKLLEVRPFYTKKLKPGENALFDDHFVIGCGEHSALELIKVQREGKRPISGREYWDWLSKQHTVLNLNKLR